MVLKGDKEFAVSGKQKDSVREETNAVLRNQHQKPLHPLSYQHREVEVRRENNVRGRSESGKFNRQPCKYFLKGTCKRSPCEYWHPSECQFFKTESGCEAGDKSLFPHHKVDEQPNKKHTQKAAFPTQRKRRQLCCSCCENCTAIGLCLARLRIIGISKEAQSLGKTRCKKVLVTNSTSTIHTVYATSSKYPGK